MTHFLRRAKRILAVAAMAGAAGSVTAQAANWDALDASEWGGDRAAKAPAERQDPFVGRVSAAFQDLGMAEARAECYGEVLLVKLKPRHRDAAVALLVASETAGDVRSNVTSEGFDIIGGFRAANKRCPDDMGS